MSFTKFSPSDAANHGDCNELFNDPAKLEDKLILNDGCKFFMSDPAERFGFLRKVGWTESLRGSKHLDSHSMWGLLASAGWDNSRLFLWQIAASTWIVLTPDGDNYAENVSDYSKM